MAQEERGTTPRALWMLLVAGPFVLAAHHQANFVLVRQACSVQHNLVLYAVNIVAMLLTLGTVLVALSIWRRAGATWPTEAGDLGNRISFVAVLGILNSVMSFLVIVAQGIATVYFNPCQL